MSAGEVYVDLSMLVVAMVAMVVVVMMVVACSHHI